MPAGQELALTSELPATELITGPAAGGEIMDPLHWFFWICAVVGGTVLICQFVLTLVGLGGNETDFADIPDDLPADVGHAGGAHGSDGSGHDAHGQHDTSWLFAMISFRTLVAASTFFGLTGLAARAAGQSVPLQLVLAVAAGVGAMYGVHWIIRTMGRLAEDGTLRIRQAIGQEGTVYIPIPAAKANAGKVQLKVQNRLVEFEAVTSAGERLATGTKVRVVGVTGTMLEVEPLGRPTAVVS